MSIVVCVDRPSVQPKRLQFRYFKQIYDEYRRRACCIRLLTLPTAIDWMLAVTWDGGARHSSYNCTLAAYLTQVSTSSKRYHEYIYALYGSKYVPPLEAN